MSASSSDAQVLVIDNGTGFTKRGYSGNAEPTFIVPTAVALADEGGGAGGAGGAAKADGVADLDFFTGEEVRARARGVGRGGHAD